MDQGLTDELTNAGYKAYTPSELLKLFGSEINVDLSYGSRKQISAHVITIIQTIFI